MKRRGADAIDQTTGPKLCTNCTNLLRTAYFACDHCDERLCTVCFQSDPHVLSLAKLRARAPELYSSVRFKGAEVAAAADAVAAAAAATTAAGGPAASVPIPPAPPKLKTYEEWTKADEALLFHGRQVFGDDYEAIARYLGSKTVAQVKARIPTEDGAVQVGPPPAPPRKKRKRKGGRGVLFCRCARGPPVRATVAEPYCPPVHCLAVTGLPVHAQGGRGSKGKGPKQNNKQTNTSCSAQLAYGVLGSKKHGRRL